MRLGSAARLIHAQPFHTVVNEMEEAGRPAKHGHTTLDKQTNSNSNIVVVRDKHEIARPI